MTAAWGFDAVLGAHRGAHPATRVSLALSDAALGRFGAALDLHRAGKLPMPRLRGLVIEHAAPSRDQLLGALSPVSVRSERHADHVVVVRRDADQPAELHLADTTRLHRPYGQPTQLLCGQAVSDADAGVLVVHPANPGQWRANTDILFGGETRPADRCAACAEHAADYEETGYEAENWPVLTATQSAFVWPRVHRQLTGNLRRLLARSPYPHNESVRAACRQAFAHALAAMCARELVRAGAKPYADGQLDSDQYGPLLDLAGSPDRLHTSLTESDWKSLLAKWMDDDMAGVCDARRLATDISKRVTEKLARS